ncbi:MAG: hypothetical protein HYR76_00665 [Ignavibacteria bacterium]|nr:hypothetical protein [Ignavibacteria bacterium]MBI3765072.1 hypothetical protein [Ignavibacteriales bacterium]
MHSKRFSYNVPLVLVAVLLIPTGFIYFRASNKYHKEVPLTNEKALKVTLDAGFGNVSVSRGQASRILDTDVDADLSSDISRYIEYSARDHVGYLNINTSEECDKSESDHHKKGSLHLSGFESNVWDMRFTDAIPISFEVELGLGKGNLDLTGLQVKDLTLSAGASSVSLRFDKLNKSVIENMTIESGLSKFTGTGLCNANFNNFKFEGGVGSYWLDFSGTLNREVDVNIEVGVGSLTVVVPDDVGAKISYEKNFISHIDLARDFSEQEDNTYFSSNYNNSRGKMNIRIEAGLGSVKIKRQ